MTSFLPKGLKYTILGALEKGTEDVEIEARIRERADQYKITTLEDFLKEEGYTKLEKHTVDYLQDGGRITFDGKSYYRTIKQQLTGPKFYQDKNDLKVTVCKEVNSEADKPSSYQMLREKNRRSYHKDNFSVDITEVVEKDLQKHTEKTKTEIEIEVIKAADFDFDDFSSLVEMVLGKLFSDDKQVIEGFTLAMGRQDSTLTDMFRFFSKARDLKFRDLTVDGLPQPFAVSHKAHGENAFLYFHADGVFLFYILRRENQLERISPLTKNLEPLKDSLFQGEIIPNHQLKKMVVSNFLFLPYDCLRFNDRDMKQSNYQTRLEQAGVLYGLNIEKEGRFYLSIEEKKTIFYEGDVEELNKAVSEIISQKKKVKYDTDGLIFTPQNSPYLTEGQLRNPRSDKRILSNFMDVCKFKKPDDLTIDLLVKKDGVYTNKGIFKGTKFNPIRPDSFIIKSSYYDKIIEFQPFEEDGKIRYKFYRDRTQDKKMPNKPSQVEENWDLRYRPILEETLTGKDILLLRAYHNQLKKGLIEKQSGYVVDLGSGKGGDLKKYKDNRRLKKILYLEPNTEFIEEFKRRQENLSMPGDIIQGGAEETLKIMTKARAYFPESFGKENLNINFMISLSFFWKSEEMLSSLADTINQLKDLYYQRMGSGDILIHFLTIEGTRLTKLFSERGDNIKLNNVILRRVGGNQIFVDIKGSQTVENQTEYVVKLDELWSKIHFYPQQIADASGKRKGDFMLSESEEVYSSLFVFGTASYSRCLPVNEKKGRQGPYGPQAVGDDAREPLGDQGLCRLAVLKTYGRLYHSLLKLISQNYRQSDVYKRLTMAKDLGSKLKGEKDLEKISYMIKHGIMLYRDDGVTKYGVDNLKWIILYQCDADNYEPVIFVDDEVHFVFGSDSYLITEA